jgi:hypothetical protein
MRRTLTTIAALCAALCAAPASAGDPPRSYFLFGVASSSFDAEAPAGCTLNPGDDGATGGALGVGYAFGAHLGLEFGFVNMGSLDASATCAGPTVITITVPDSGLQLSGIARLPLGAQGEASGFALFGRAGAFSWSKDAQSGTEAVLGAGAEWRWSAHQALRLELTDYGDGPQTVQLTLRWDY